jgi:predicted HTH transcriptional regulator
MRRTKETKSEITIPEDWIKEIEKKPPDNKYLSADKRKQIIEFIKKYYPAYTKVSIAAICKVSPDTIRKIIKELKLDNIE